MRTNPFSGPRSLGIFFAVVAAFASAPGRTADLVAVDVAQFFVEPNVVSVLRWKSRNGAPVEEQPYTVMNYWRQETATGKATVAADGVLEVRVALPPGYFEIGLPKSSAEFGIASVPAFSGDRDRFFAIDSAMSWLVKDRDVRDGLVRILERSGISMSRERLNWGAISSGPRKFDWETSQGYDELRQAYSRHGVEVLEMSHDTPSWLGRVGKYPADLSAASKQWIEIAQRWQPTWGALEIWNEPDIFFGDNLPGDQYAALVKSLAFGLRSTKFPRPIVGGVVAHYNEDFLDSCFANGMFACVDLLSFHTYSRAPEMESLVEKYRTWLQRHGHGGMRLWLTECGRPWKKGPGRPPLDEDANSALDIIMKAVEARVCGVDRHFPFVYPYYEENDSNFGMMARNGDPLRCMAGYAQLVRTISHKQYLGDVRSLPETVKRARAFGDDKNAVLVLYTGESRADAKIACDIPSNRIEGLDGRPLTVTDQGTLPVPDGLVYLFVERSQLDGRLNVDTKAKTLSPPASGATPLSAGPIVMRLELDPKSFSAETSGYRLARKSTGPLSLKVRAFNLGSQIEKVRFEFTPGAGSVENNEPQSLEIPAESSVDLSWKIDLSSALKESPRASVEVRGHREGGEADSVLALTFLAPKPPKSN